jgi:hypothetical protein
LGIESRDVRSATGADDHAKNLFIVNESILFYVVKFPFAGNLSGTTASLAFLDVARYENGDGSTSFSMTSGASCMLKFIAKAKNIGNLGLERDYESQSVLHRIGGCPASDSD